MNQLVFLRIIGFLFGAGIMLFAFDQFRRGRFKRLDFTLSLFFSGSIILIAFKPDVSNLLLDIFSLRPQRFARLIALLIFSNFAIWLFLIYARVKFNRRDQQFDLLIRSLGLEDFDRNYTSADIQPITIVLPAYNEAANLPHVLERIPKSINGIGTGALVVDDGSEDDSRSVIESYNVPVVSNRMNRGGGAALRLGYDIATRYGAEIVVTMDADGQHLPEEIENLVTPILEGTFDFVIGSRVLGSREKDDPIRYLGVRLFSILINFLARTRITDCSSGFRAFEVKKLNSVTLRQDQFHTGELIVDAARKGVRIGEAPVTIMRRRNGASKKGANWRYGFQFMKTILASWWR